MISNACQKMFLHLVRDVKKLIKIELSRNNDYIIGCILTFNPDSVFVTIVIFNLS